MAFAAERQLIESYVQDYYTDTSVKYDNIPFDQPTGEPFISLTILSGTGTNTALGGQRVRYTGVIQVDIYVPENSGTRAARDIASSLRDLFTNKEITDGSTTITCRVASLNRVAKAPAGKYRISVTIPYTFDE